MRRSETVRSVEILHLFERDLTRRSGVLDRGVGDGAALAQSQNAERKRRHRPSASATTLRRPRARRRSFRPSASESHCAAILMASDPVRLSSLDNSMKSAGHAIEEVGGGQLAAFAEKDVEQFRRAFANGLDFEVVPRAPGAQSLGKMQELFRDRTSIVPAGRAASASGDQNARGFPDASWP